VFVGNLLYGDEGFGRPLLAVDQTPALCGKVTDSPLAKVDGNVYVRRGDTATKPLIRWSPAEGAACTAQLTTPSALAAIVPGFDAHSTSKDGIAGAFFQSPELRNYRPASPIAPVVTEDPLPDEVKTLLGWAPDAKRGPGAYAGQPAPPARTLRGRGTK
jgi:hypothetical protein